MQAFEEAHRQAITWLHRDGQLPIHRLDPAHPRHPGPARSWRCPLGLP
jgi:hypothetical protein